MIWPTEWELVDSMILDGITVGTRRQYADESLKWVDPDIRTRSELLARVHGLAKDSLVLRDAFGDAYFRIGALTKENATLEKMLGCDHPEDEWLWHEDNWFRCSLCGFAQTEDEHPIKVWRHIP